MKILSIENVSKIVKRRGLENFLRDLIKQLKNDFSRWEEFNKIPRPAMHVKGGVIELMPICDGEYYTYKYVNCHPKNTKKNLLTVVATGQLSRVSDGYPVLVSEMTLLTALRTAATTALATDLIARKNSQVHAIIGTGAQSEFLVRAITIVRDIKEVRYFDIDAKAMDKFEKNLKGAKFMLTRCQSVEEAVQGADIITTCTAERANVEVLKNKWIKEGVHINGIGGDSIGKTELDFSILARCKIVVEYFDQAVIEGEIQRWSKAKARAKVHAELHELIRGEKTGRVSDNEITLYDSVGIALEDYSALTLIYAIAEMYGIGQEINLVPRIKNPKNLISLLK